VSHHSSRGARSAPARPPYQPLSQQAPSEQAAAGSGLLSELQLSLRTECVCEPLRSSPAEGPWTAEACCRFPGASPLARHQSSHPSIHPSPNQPFSPLRQPTLPTRIPPNKTITLQTSHFPQPHRPPPPLVPTERRIPEQRSGHHPSLADRSVGTPHTYTRPVHHVRVHHDVAHVVAAQRKTPQRRAVPPIRRPTVFSWTCQRIRCPENPNAPPHRLTLVGHSPKHLHSCQYFVERPRWTLSLIRKCAHGVHCGRIRGATSMQIFTNSAATPP
jgi:hypothetical protein